MGLLARYPAFRNLWFGQLLSQFGNAVFVIMGLWEIELRSPFLLSLAGMAMMAPTLLMVVGGTIVDRHHPVRLMLGTDVARGVAVGLGLLALMVPGSLPWDVIGLLLVNSLGGTLFSPAEAVVLPRLVSDADLTGANGVYSVTSLLTGAVGSAIGGAAIAAIGVRLIFGFDMVTFWLSALALWLVLRAVEPSFRDRTGAAPIDPVEEGSARSEGRISVLGSLREGLEALKGFGWFLKLVPFIVITNFAYNAGFTMLPYWSRHELHTTALGFGLIDAVWALGMVSGSLLVGRVGRFPLLKTNAVLGLFQGLLTLGFAFAPVFPVSVAVLGLAGVANGMVNALVFTLFQRMIPEAVRGRAFGAFLSVLTVASPLGALASGLTLHVLPLGWTWGLGGLSVIVLSVVMWRLPGEDAGMPSKTPAEAVSV